MACSKYSIYSRNPFVLLSKKLASVLIESQGTAYPSQAPGFIPSGVRVALFLVFCFVLCFFVLCFPSFYALRAQMLPVSLDCPFLIAASVFSNVII